jgi:alkanesulfonate monooxygenase SsuD/methylene tetrahydromethanopterin reductase-like flavin-dependent oxidoreductase (luciferase family)
VSRSDRGRDFIAEHCDWWFVDYPKTAETTSDVLRGIEESVADMKRRADRLGRKVRYALNPFVALGKTNEDALEAAIKRIFAFDPDPDTRKIESRMLPATKIGCIGPPDGVRRQLRRFEDLGIEMVLCKMIPTIENLQHIGEEIIAPMRRTEGPLSAAG